MFNPFEDQEGFRYKLLNDTTLEYYSVGDVHGCSKELGKLLKKINKDAESRGKKAFIISHGDIIDRGPDFLGSLYASKTMMDLCLLGNHEHNFVLERLGKDCTSNSRKESHNQFEKSSNESKLWIMDFLNHLYNFAVIEIDKRTFILSHAPIKDMETYTDWKKYIHIGNAPYFCMRSSVPIDEDMKKLNKQVTFVYGHQSWEYKNLEEQVNEQSERKSQYYNIDAGCVYGGKLVALRLRDLGVISVQSKVKVAKH